MRMRSQEQRIRIQRLRKTVALAHTEVGVALSVACEGKTQLLERCESSSRTLAKLSVCVGRVWLGPGVAWRKWRGWLV
jgi:hypothetical protein